MIFRGMILAAVMGSLLGGCAVDCAPSAPGVTG